MTKSCVRYTFCCLAALNLATMAWASDYRYWVPDDGGGNYDRAVNWTNLTSGGTGIIPSTNDNAMFFSPRRDWERVPALVSARSISNIVFTDSYHLNQNSVTNDVRSGRLTVHGDITATSSGSDVFDQSYNTYLGFTNDPGQAVQMPVLFTPGTHTIFASNTSGRIAFVDSIAWTGGSSNVLNLIGRGSVQFATPRNAWPCYYFNNSAVYATNYSALSSGYLSGYTNTIADVINVGAGNGTSGGLVLTPAEKGQYRRYTNNVTLTQYVSWEGSNDFPNVLRVATVNMTTNNARLAVQGYDSSGNWANQYWPPRASTPSTSTKGGIALIDLINVSGVSGVYTSRIDQYNATLNVSTITVASAKTLFWTLYNASAVQGDFTKTGDGTLKSASSGSPTRRFACNITVSAGTYEDNVGVASNKNVTLGSSATLNSKGASSPTGLYIINNGGTANDTGSTSPYLVKGGGTLNAYGSGEGVITVESDGTVNTYATWNAGQNGFDNNTWDPGWYQALTYYISDRYDPGNGVAQYWYFDQGYEWGTGDYAPGNLGAGQYGSISVQAGGILNAPSANAAATVATASITLRGTVNLRIGLSGDSTKADSLAVDAAGTLDYGGTLALTIDGASTFTAGQTWRLFSSGSAAATPVEVPSNSVTFYPWLEFHNAIVNDQIWTDGVSSGYGASDGNTYFGDEALAWYWSDYNFGDGALHWTVEQIQANGYSNETYVIRYYNENGATPTALSAATTHHFDAVTASGKFGNLTFTRDGSAWTARTGVLKLTFDEATGVLSVSPSAFRGTILYFK